MMTMANGSLVLASSEEANGCREGDGSCRGCGTGVKINYIY